MGKISSSEIRRGKNEACQLFIEQQVREGLDRGENPHSIGKDLSGWVAKLFETTINARSIEQRARRIKNATFVASEPSNGKQKENTKSNKSNRGGARKGAGRKTSKAPLKERLSKSRTMKINDACGFDKEMFYAIPENKIRLAYITIDGGLSSVLEVLRALDDKDQLLDFIDNPFCEKWDSVFEIIEELVTKHRNADKKIGGITK